MCLKIEKELYIDNNVLYSQCPACATILESVVTNNETNMRCKCCDSSYRVSLNNLERRKHCRKTTALKAKCFSAKHGGFRAIIINISNGGLKFTVNKSNCNLQLGDSCSINFFIDEDSSVEIFVKVVNASKKANDYGCIFLEKYAKSDIEKIRQWI
jgi:hypothetical protein